MVDSLLAELDARLGALGGGTTAEVRQVRRWLSRSVRHDDRLALRIAARLVARDGPWDRFLAYETLNVHPTALGQLTVAQVSTLGHGIDSWGDVDMFACFVAGPTWRERRLSDAEVLRWARSRDRWWRRAAVVSTVPLNSRARGGDGDAPRTLRICSVVLDDRDPMVVKAVSWALRELGKRNPLAVRTFLGRNEERLAALVRREVTTKLDTGVKARRARLDRRA